MHITNKALIFIAFCIIVVIVSYEYYAYEHRALEEKTTDTAIVILQTVATTTPTTESLHIGETKNIGGVAITIDKIIEDSRCPSNVQCIQAGRVVVGATVYYGTSSEVVTFTEHQSPLVYNGHTISVKQITPEKTTEQITREDYIITLEVLH